MGITLVYGRQDFDVDETVMCLGDAHTCVLRRKGRSLGAKVDCRGDNRLGQSDIPKNALGSDYVQLACGSFHTCALHISGKVTCWGSVSYAPSDSFVHISAGGKHVCGILNSGKVVCWGQRFSDAVPMPENDSFSQISVGAKHACGLTRSGKCKCWGEEAHAAIPADYQEYLFLQISVSHGYDAHTCGLLKSGEAVCWGTDSFRQCDAQPHYFEQICAGERYNCGVEKKTKRVHCWGSVQSLEPLPDYGDFDLIACGPRHMCARSNGAIQCFGRDDGISTT